MTEKDKEQAKKDKEKTDKLLDEVIEAELVPMEHSITIKFIQKTNLKMENMKSYSREDVLKELNADEISHSIESWVTQNVRSNKNLSVTELTYHTHPYGLEECLTRNKLKGLLKELVENL